MMRPSGILTASLAVLAVHLGLETAFGSDGVLDGRLTDSGGAAVANATILVFPADQAIHPGPCDEGAGDRSGLVRADGCRESSRLHTDSRGAFSAVLPQGRFVVAAMKRGYDITMTRAYTRAGRVLQMRMQPSHPRGTESAQQDASWLDTDWYLSQKRADVLREEEASIPEVVYLAAGPAESGAGSAEADGGRAFLGRVDGDLAHSFGAESLLGLAERSGESGEGARTTALTLRAPLSQELAWNLQGMSARTRIGLPDGAGRLAGGSDRLAFGVDYASTRGRARIGTLRAWLGTDVAGTGRIDQRVLEGSGELALAGNPGRRLAVGVRAWAGEADLGDGTFLTLDRTGVMQPGAGRTEGEGFSVYTGERLQLGTLTRLDYGLEYRADTLSGDARPVPRLGVIRTLEVRGMPDLTVRTELLLDPGRPGGTLAIQAAPFDQLQVSASLSVLPANAVIETGPVRTGRPAAWGLPSPGQGSAETRSIDVEVAGDFGVLSGSLSGSVGRAGPRDLPLIEEGPLSLVSFGSERFHETRLGVAYKPWEARVEVGYLRVESEARREDVATQGPPPDYGRLDLLFSKVIPSPRSMLGARLRALLEWQGVGYDSVLAANSGSSLSGVTSRLSGGVGLTF